jgi:molybdopterin converting factor small subunit
MANLVYIVTGQVIDRDTSLGSERARVQAWDTNTQQDRMLAEMETDKNGRFSTSIDLQQFNYETPPDLFFKVFIGETLMESTENSVLWNANTQESVTIRIRTGRVRPAGRDRITSAQVFKGVEFLQKSDFKGVFKEFKSRTGTTAGFVADMFVNTFTNVDLEPVRVKGAPQNDVVNQEVEVARRNLAAKNVAVTEVLPYQPGLNSESIKSIDVIPRNLKAGQEVRLFEENGRVRYYAILKPRTTTADVDDKIESQSAEMNKLKEELKATRETIAAKDEKINSLEKQIENMDKDQKEINTVLKSDAFARLMKEVQKPTPPTSRKKPEN